MPTVVTSKHLQGATELTLIAPIKPGFVAIPDAISYASRLRTTFEFLFVSRQRALERDGLVGIAGPLERLRSLHFVHWSIHDQDRRLLLAVSFDGPWEPYIRAIVDEAGPILDVIFSHCEGYAGNSCFDGYQKFAAWVRQRQVGVDFFYAGSPDVTVDDVRYLQDFERKYASGKRPEDFEAVAAKLRVSDPPSPPLDFPRSREVLTALYRIGRQFPGAGAAGGADDAAVFGRVAALLTREMRAALFGNAHGKPTLSIPDGLNRLEKAALAWSEGPLSRHDLALAPAVHEELSGLDAVQGNILSKYPAMSHGALLLARFESPPAALAFVQKWQRRIDTEVESVEGRETRADFPLAPETRFNLALTKSGLRALGVSPEELALFPKEFQEGLAERSGMLGDIGLNHPSAWERPILNFAKASPSSYAANEPPERLNLESVDLILVLQRSAPERDGDHTFSDANPLFDEILALGKEEGLQVLHVQPLRSYGKGHFGLVDGASQPRHRGTTEPDVVARDQVALGELLLGYKNERGERVLAAEDERAALELGMLPRQLLQNSTFLVVRKMSQNVAAFNEAMNDAAVNSGLSSEAYKTTLLGRKADGAAIVQVKNGPNDFDYADKDGEKCPLFSHVRRANPRDVKRQNGRELLPPRIVRRGMSYGSLYENDRESTDRGIVFLAYAASLAEQYEVIQRWVNGGNSSGVASAHPDLLAGTFPHRPRSERSLSFQHEGQLKKLPVPQTPFTALRWGLYLFVPSTTALEFLVKRPRRGPARLSPQDRLGVEKKIGELLALDQVDARRGALEWKRVLEDSGQRALARALWQYIREEREGVLETSYGVLVGSADGVRAVLEKDKDYSVRRYWTRMKSTFGEHYLGMDPEPQALPEGAAASAPLDGGDFDAQADDYADYASQVPAQSYLRSSEVPNQFAMGISRKQAYECAFAETQAWFRAQTRSDVDVITLGRDVTYAVAVKLFGLPGTPYLSSEEELTPTADPPARCPIDFQRVSQFIFGPRPSAALGEVARSRGGVVKQQLSAFLASPESADSPFCRHYRAGSKSLDESPVNVAPALAGMAGEVSALNGLVNGFAVPTSASFVSVLMQWLDSQRLWHHQRWLYGKTSDDEGYRAELVRGTASEEDLGRGPLWQGIVEALSNAPVPELLHRVATGTSRLGGVEITPGKRVVVSLASAALEGRLQGDAKAWAVLFGGDRESDGKAVHACPGQRMAFGVLLGMLVGVLTQKNLTRLDKTRITFEKRLDADG